MAKIAVELEQALARRAAAGEPAKVADRVLANAPGWRVSDVICTSGPNDSTFEEQHDQVSIAIVTAGTFQYRSLAGRELMTPGSLLLGNPQQCFECDHAHGHGDRCIAFRYSPDYFEALKSDAGIPNSRGTFAVHRLPLMKELSQLIAKACSGLTESADASWEELSIQLAVEALRLASGRSLASYEAPPSALARVTRTVRMIDRHSDAPLTLATLSQEAGLTPFHFIRTFERLTGLTPHQYVLRTRLRNAALRLVSRSEKILDIALDSGFGDISNFNRAFRAEFGQSPRAFRQQS